MKKIHHLFIESKETEIEKIVIKLIKLLPKQLYITYDILYFSHNKSNNKITLILDCLNRAEVIIIKFYVNRYPSIPDELLYLSEYAKNHYFYKDCYLAYCNYNHYDISIVKCKKADGDIHNLKMNINDYTLLKDSILDELCKMHFNGYVHMDIKTTNILYKKTKDGIIFGLCDFDLVNYIGLEINPVFKRYYHKIYKIEIPKIYSEEFENYAFEQLLYLIRINKTIKANTY